MTTQDQQTVSIEAHNRMTRERDELKAKVDELSKVVTDVGLRDRAEAHFASKDATNARQLAELALPHLRGIEDLDSIPERLASVVPDNLIVTQEAPPPTNEAPAEEPAPPAEPPAPRPAIAGPDPAAPGTPPAPDKLKINSPEMKRRIQEQGYRAAIDGAIASGELVADPQNDHAQRILGG